VTFAPPTLRALADYWIDQGGVNLGIVGDTGHADRGVSYHLGKDQLRSDAYSIQTARDKAGLTNAASAIDLGRLGGTLGNLRKFSDDLARRCVKNAPGTFDVREVIYSPDGRHVLGYKDGIDFLIPGYGDDTHLTHTHISFYRDSEFRDKIALFKPWFTLPDTGAPNVITFDLADPIETGVLTVDGAGHSYFRLKDGTLHAIAAGARKRCTGPVVLPTGTILGDSLERRTGWLIGLEAAFLLDVDVNVVLDRKHARSTDA